MALPAGVIDPFGDPLPMNQTAVADGQHLARGAAANFLVLVAANFRGVFTFLIARLLGEAVLGRFGLVFAATELLSKAGMLGLDNAVVPAVARRVAAGDGDGARLLFRRAALTTGVVSLGVAIAAVPTTAALAATGGLDAFSGSMLIMLLALPGIAVARVSTGASRAVLAVGDEFYSRGLSETWVTTAMFLVAVALGMRDGAPALAVVVGTAAGGAVAFALATRSLRRVPGFAIAGRQSMGHLLRFSAPIAGSSLLGVLVARADVLLLGAYVGRAGGVSVEAFGIYCAAAEIAGGMRKVRQMFDPIFAPVVATRRASSGGADLQHTVAAPARWVLAAQLPLVGVLLLASGAVLNVYGDAFREGALWLAFLGVAHGMNSFAGLVETLLMIERPRLNLVNAAATVAMQFASGWLLIPWMGVTGAALAMLIGLGGQGILRFVELRHVFGWGWPWRALSRPVIAFAVALAPGVAVRMVGGLGAELASAGLFLVLYAGVWRVLGAEPADREIWRRLRRRNLDS